MSEKSRGDDCLHFSAVRGGRDPGISACLLLQYLVNYRPEYQHGWGSKTFYTQVRLDPLPPASAEAFLAGLLGDDPSLVPLLPLLMARTVGNSFFLEESVRTLVETGVLVGDRGAYHLVKPLDTLQVPATVQALLAARIDRLPPEDKRLLQTAAVIGTEVPWPLLQAIAATSDEALSRSLAQLQAAEFLYETSLFPEPAYTFKHALTHEVAYGSLLHERRHVLHARIVDALEALAGDRLDDQVERLAHHALRGEVWDKALAYGRQAGEKALARSAHREAVGCFEQALVLTRLSEAYLLAGRLEEARQRAAQAVECARQYKQRGWQAWALWLLGESMARQASPEVELAAGHYRQALSLADELGMRPLQAHCHRGLGTLYATTGQREQACIALSTAIEMYRGMEMTLWLPQTETALAQVEA